MEGRQVFYYNNNKCNITRIRSDSITSTVIMVGQECFSTPSAQHTEQRLAIYFGQNHNKDDLNCSKEAK